MDAKKYLKAMETMRFAEVNKPHDAGTRAEGHALETMGAVPKVTYGSDFPTSVSNDEDSDAAPVKQGCCARPQKQGSKPKKPTIPISALFRYSTPCERVCVLIDIYERSVSCNLHALSPFDLNCVLQVLYGIGCTCAIIAGSALPLFTLIFGSLIDSFGSSQNGSTEKLTTAIQNLCPYFVIIGVVTGFCSLIDSLGSVMITEYTLSRVRHEYMLSLLRQDVGWHDTNRGGEATARLAEGSLAMSSGMEKLPAVGKAFGTLVGVPAS